MNSTTDVKSEIADNNGQTAADDVKSDTSDFPLPTSLNLRSASLVVIAVLLSFAALRLASAVFIPLVMGLMFSYALSPLVNRMERWHIPRALASALLLLGLTTGIGSVINSLGDEMEALVDAIPEVAQKLRRDLNSAAANGPASTIEKVQKAATELERTAEDTQIEPPAASGVTKVQIEEPRFNIMEYLLPSTLGALAAAANIVVVLFIAFFLLVAGDRFRRKLVKLAGPTLTRKKVTLQALDEITHQIQRYLLVQVFTSSVVGIVTWLTFLWIGVEHASVWGIVAFVFNFIPYIGSIITTTAAMVIGYTQFDSLDMVLLIGGAVLVINMLEGYLLTPLMTSHANRMNPVAIFAGVLAWGWLWGIWGLFLGVPILVVIKTVCDRVEDFKVVGELLGK
jgi:predicted PurR-regulated permease PerM